MRGAILPRWLSWSGMRPRFGSRVLHGLSWADFTDSSSTAQRRRLGQRPTCVRIWHVIRIPSSRTSRHRSSFPGLCGHTSAVCTTYKSDASHNFPGLHGSTPPVCITYNSNAIHTFPGHHGSTSAVCTTYKSNASHTFPNFLFLRHPCALPTKI
jgi:hypothetical protein